MKKGLFMLLSGLLAFSAAKAQESPKGPEAPVAGQQLVRLSKITVDPARLAGYNAFLQEEIEASLRLEPGVLALYAVAAKEAPGQVTILEIYADRAAYESHITTPHSGNTRRALSIWCFRSNSSMSSRLCPVWSCGRRSVPGK